MNRADVYYVVADDRCEYLVILVMVNGPASVVGRFDDRADAQAEADRWMAFEMEAA